MTTTQNATERYHSSYDNQAYKKLGRAIGQDYQKEDDNYITITNLIIDTTFEICGDEHQAGAHIKLATTLAVLGTELPLIEEISAYLGLFQEPDQTLKTSKTPHWHCSPSTKTISEKPLSMPP